MAELCYLEFSVDPDQLALAHRDLNRAGFRLRSHSQSDHTRFYSQGSAVIQLRKMQGAEFGFSGIGLAASNEEVAALQRAGSIDPETNFLITSDGEHRITLFRTHQVNELINQNFTTVDSDDPKGVGINYFSGIVVPTVSPGTKAFWKELGFDITRTGAWSETAISAKRKFSVIFSEQERTTIIADTNVIFDSVASMLVAGFESSRAVPVPETFNHPNGTKAQAYECSVFGNSESYSVEKFYPGALGNADLLLRQRKQYLHIPEKNLETHYGAITDNG